MSVSGTQGLGALYLTACTGRISPGVEARWRLTQAVLPVPHPQSPPHNAVCAVVQVDGPSPVIPVGTLRHRGTVSESEAQLPPSSRRGPGAPVRVPAPIMQVCRHTVGRCDARVGQGGRVLPVPHPTAAPRMTHGCAYMHPTGTRIVAEGG